MTITNIISLLALILANGGALIMFFVNLSTKIANNTKDYMNMRREFEEHKVMNNVAFNDIKMLLKEDRATSAHGYEKVIDAISTIKEEINTVKIDIIKSLGAKHKKANEND